VIHFVGDRQNQVGNSLIGNDLCHVFVVPKDRYTLDAGAQFGWVIIDQTDQLERRLTELGNHLHQGSTGFTRTNDKHALLAGYGSESADIDQAPEQREQCRSNVKNRNAQAGQRVRFDREINCQVSNHRNQKNQSDPA